MSRAVALWDVEADSLARLDGGAWYSTDVLVEIRCKRHNEWVGAVVDHHVYWGGPAYLPDIAYVAVHDERMASSIKAQREAFPEVPQPRRDRTSVRAFHLDGSTASAHEALPVTCPKAHRLDVRIADLRLWVEQARRAPETAVRLHHV